MDNYTLKGKKNPKIKTVDGDVLKFYLNKDDLSDPSIFENFISSCENIIRKDDRYTNYISYLKENGYIKDVFQSDIDNDKFPDISIEMHHGPIFNLFEICSIVTDHLLENDELVNTFKIADIVLTEHELGNIQVVMGLTKTNHQLAHSGSLFIHINQSIGNIMEFIKKYKNGIRREHLYTLEKYLHMCSMYDATDNDYLSIRKIVKKIKKYINENDED